MSSSIENDQDPFSEVNLSNENDNEDTCCYVTRIIFGIIFIVFFLIYGLCMFFIPFAYDKESEANDDVFELEEDISLIALHFCTMVFAIVFGILLICLPFDIPHGIILAIFAIFWIAYMAVFFTSDTYQYISAKDSPFQNVYSYQQYKDFWSKWSKTNPNLILKYHDENTSYVCQSKSFQFLSSTSVNTNNEPQKIHFDDETGRNPAMFIVKLSLEVEWEQKSAEKIAQLENKIKSCSNKPAGTTIKIHKDNSLPELYYSLLITKDGKVPPKFKPINVVLFGVFWAGVRTNFDLRSISLKTDTIKKTESVISDESIGKFTCDHLNANLQCWDRVAHAECYAQDKSIQRPKATDDSPGYSRERLSRAFYLSDAAYGHLDYFEDSKAKKVYTWSKPLLDTYIIKSTANGFCYPAFYVGRYKNEIWIAVRGSHSLYDWLSDAKAVTEHAISGSYHKGFYEAGLNIWAEIAGIFIDQQYKDCTFYFTGHSYGGAVANVLHKIASHCFSDLTDRMYGFTFGAPPAMGQETSKEIKDHIYTFVNSHDLVPRLSLNSGKRMLLLCSAIYTVANSEQQSREIDNTVKKSLEIIATDGYQDDKVSRPIGNVYHLTSKFWVKEGSQSIEKSKTTEFMKFPFINILGAINHFLSAYSNKFKKYKDGVMKPDVFDPNVVVSELTKTKAFPSNPTIFDLMNIENPDTYFNGTIIF